MRSAWPLAGFQAGDAGLCAIPVTFIKKDLDRLQVPSGIQDALPLLKGASALGLVVGARHPRVGQLAAASLVAYFLAALGVHARAHDGALRYAPAAGMLAWSLLTLRTFAQTHQPVVAGSGNRY